MSQAKAFARARSLPFTLCLARRKAFKLALSQQWRLALALYDVKQAYACVRPRAAAKRCSLTLRALPLTLLRCFCQQRTESEPAAGELENCQNWRKQQENVSREPCTSHIHLFGIFSVCSHVVVVAVAVVVAAAVRCSQCERRKGKEGKKREKNRAKKSGHSRKLNQINAALYVE